MKKLLLAATVVLAPIAVAADPVKGVWQTEPDDGAYSHVKIASCGSKLCGTIIRSFQRKEDNSGWEQYESKNIGRKLLYDMVADGEDSYSGKAWWPSRDREIRGSMTLNGKNRLRAGGCVLGGIVCIRQTWKRIK
ncbi:MAG: DUF2147 domain-containing protein [Pseudomonadota bacterium]